MQKKNAVCALQQPDWVTFIQSHNSQDPEGLGCLWISLRATPVYGVTEVSIFTDVFWALIVIDSRYRNILQYVWFNVYVKRIDIQMNKVS